MNRSTLVRKVVWFAVLLLPILAIAQTATQSAPKVVVGKQLSAKAATPAPGAKALKRPAAIRYAASSPKLLDWMARFNEGRPYPEQIRPFNFLLAFMPRTGVFAPCSEQFVDELKRGPPLKRWHPAPIAPYDSDPQRALSKVFDRITGRPVHTEQLKTYTEVLAQYHLSSEDKFLNGQFRDRGRTERRHVVATGQVWIGKEANQVGESGEADPIWSAVEEFACSSPKAA